MELLVGAYIEHQVVADDQWRTIFDTLFNPLRTPLLKPPSLTQLNQPRSINKFTIFPILASEHHLMDGPKSEKYDG